MARTERAKQRQDALGCLGGICGVLNLYNLIDSNINIQGCQKGSSWRLAWGPNPAEILGNCRILSSEAA